MPGEATNLFPLLVNDVMSQNKNKVKNQQSQHIQSEHIQVNVLQSYCIEELFMVLLIAGACLLHRCSVHNFNWTIKTIAVLMRCW